MFLGLTIWYWIANWCALSLGRISYPIVSYSFLDSCSIFFFIQDRVSLFLWEPVLELAL